MPVYFGMFPRKTHSANLSRTSSNSSIHSTDSLLKPSPIASGQSTPLTSDSEGEDDFVLHMHVPVILPQQQLTNLQAAIQGLNLTLPPPNPNILPGGSPGTVPPIPSRKSIMPTPLLAHNRTPESEGTQSSRSHSSASSTRVSSNASTPVSSLSSSSSSLNLAESSKTNSK